MKISFVLGLVILTALGASAQTVQPATPKRPIPEVEHVMIVSIDGLRPDLALLHEMPNLRSLLADGAYTFWAKTTAVSVTLPSHTSMLTGVTPQKHGVEWNRDLPFSEPVYPRVPTIFEMARGAGYTTAMVAGKSKFIALTRPGSLTWAWVPTEPKATDDDVAPRAVEMIESHRPQLLFVHLPSVDAAGHAHGWGSAKQKAAVEGADRALGALLAALERAKMRTSTVIMITADHGGAGLTHGAEDPRSRHIPWIVAGPGVRKNLDLTTLASLEVRIEDTAATACYVLGLPLPPNFDGRPVAAAFESR